MCFIAIPTQVRAHKYAHFTAQSASGQQRNHSSSCNHYTRAVEKSHKWGHRKEYFNGAKFECDVLFIMLNGKWKNFHHKNIRTLFRIKEHFGNAPLQPVLLFIHMNFAELSSFAPLFPFSSRETTQSSCAKFTNIKNFLVFPMLCIDILILFVFIILSSNPDLSDTLIQL